MSEATNLYAVKSVIRIIRHQRVILDSDLAKLYGVPAKRLNEAVKRNLKRFPADFMFQLDAQENAVLRSHIATLKNQQPANQGVTSNWSQIATSSSKHRGTTYLPYAFTEHGIIMAASVLNSDRAIEMSVFIARTFVRMREQLLASTANAKRLAEIEKTLLTHDSALFRNFIGMMEYGEYWNDGIGRLAGRIGILACSLAVRFSNAKFRVSSFNIPAFHYSNIPLFDVRRSKDA